MPDAEPVVVAMPQTLRGERLARFTMRDKTRSRSSTIHGSLS
jgi:hypothetical protein